LCQSGSRGSLERCLFFGFGFDTEVDEEIGIAAGFVSGLEDECAVFWLALEGSATPTLFDEVPLLEGVGKL
jgi:hypothetical protein